MRRFVLLLPLIAACCPAQEAADSLRPQLQSIARRRLELVVRLQYVANAAVKTALDLELQAVDHYEVLLRDSIQTLTSLDDARAEEARARTALAESRKNLANLAGDIEKRLAALKTRADAAPPPSPPALLPREAPGYSGVWALRADEDRSESGPTAMQLEMAETGDRISGTGKAVFGQIRIEGTLVGTSGPAHAVVTLLDGSKSPVLTLRVVPGVRSIEVVRLESALPQVQPGGPDVLWRREKE